MEIRLYSFLMPTLYGGEWSGLYPGRFTSRERTWAVYELYYVFVSDVTPPVIALD